LRSAKSAPTLWRILISKDWDQKKVAVVEKLWKRGELMNSIGWRVFFCVSYLLAIEQTVFAGTAFAQIYHVQEMNTEQIKALEREKTVVLLPVGILEEHGPYLPSLSDGYITAHTQGNRAATARVLVCTKPIC
jgi:hypothetical protein